jgi:hypothetical protein
MLPWNAGSGIPLEIAAWRSNSTKGIYGDWGQQGDALRTVQRRNAEPVLTWVGRPILE